MSHIAKFEGSWREAKALIEKEIDRVWLDEPLRGPENPLGCHRQRRGQRQAVVLRAGTPRKPT